MIREFTEDKKWVEATKTDPAAFQHLFDKYYGTISNYILRRTGDETLAKDIAASTFMKALDGIHRFVWKGLPFSAWLYRIATNEINQHFRRNRKLVRLTETRIAVLPGDSFTDSGIAAEEDQKETRLKAARVLRALHKIKPRYQDVLTLRYYEELPIREIAVILHLPENTIKTQIRRGLEQLKKQL